MMRGLVGLASVAVLTGCATAPARREAAQPSPMLMALGRVLPQDTGAVIVIQSVEEARGRLGGMADAQAVRELEASPFGSLLFGAALAAELEPPLLGVATGSSGGVFVIKVRDAAGLQTKLRALYPAAVELPSSTPSAPMWADKAVAWHLRGGVAWLAAKGGEQALRRACLPCQPSGGWSLADDDGWRRLSARRALDPATVFIPMTSPAFAEVFEMLSSLPLSEANSSGALRRLVGATRGGALGLSAAGSEIQARLWLPLDAWGAERAAQLSTSAGVKLQDSIPPDAVWYARLGIGSLAAWRQLVELLSAEERAALDTEIARLTGLLGVEPSFERALVDALTGDALLVMTPGTGGDVLDMGPYQLSMLVALRDAGRAAGLAEQLVNGARSKGVGVGEREVDGAKRWEVEDGGQLPAMYVRGERVLFASRAMPEAEALAILSGGHRGAKREGLGAQGLTAGKSALYMSGEAIKALAPGNRALHADTLMTLDMADGGVEVTLTQGAPAQFGRRLVNLALSGGHEPTSRVTGIAQLWVSWLAEGAKWYFISEQRYSTPDGSQPWHVAEASGARSAGMPVPYEDYVFPGGDNFKWTSLAAVPRGEAARSVDELSAVERAALERLSVQWGDDWVEAWQLPQRFRYTYESRGRGVAATVVIRAEADLNPETPEHHTIEVRIHVNPETDEVIVSPVLILNDGE